MDAMKGGFLFCAVAFTIAAVMAFLNLQIYAGVMTSFMAWAAWYALED
jgi:hypothetical protein